MTKTWKLLVLAVIASSSFNVCANQTTVQMTMETFMEDYAKPASELAKKGNNQAINQVLKVVPSLALPEQQQQWQQIIDKAVAAGNPGASCRACHKDNKKSYQNTHADRLVSISANVITELQASLK